MAKESRRDDRLPQRAELGRTLILMAVCGVAAFALLIGRLFYLQILQHDELSAAAESQQLRETVLAGERGRVYDRNGNILAVSADVDTVYLSPAEIKMYGEDPEIIAQGLHEILGCDRQKILDMCADTASWYKTVARKLEPELIAELREFKNEHNIKGIKIEPDTKRYYPYGNLAAHVIGYTGYDGNGLSGMELSLDTELSGVPGRIVRAKNAYGTDMLYTKYEDYVAAEAGLNAVLTIDSSIQYFVEKHLSAAVEEYDIQGGAAAIAMDVNTGEILAMASLGNFDPNNYQLLSTEAQAELDTVTDETEREELQSRMQQAMWRNKAISDTYEPGSTFKIITLAMALEENVVGLNEHFYCGGSISVIGDGAGRGRKCWKTQGHGSQSLTECIQHSCNVALIQMGQRVGAERFYDYAEAFGLFGKTGIELSGEASGLWWSEEVFCNPMSQSQLAAASFGQTFNITPLQLIRAVSACVNGGKLMEPYLLKELRDEAGNVVESTEPTVTAQVISPETSAEIRGILEQVVCDPLQGTGKNAYVAGYRIGGKTGTSTKTVLEAGGTKEYIVSFIGFAPADEPEICILVLLDDPSGQTGHYVSGGSMAAPVVGKMFADILPYMGIEPQYTESEKELMDRAVPQVKGLSLEEADRLLKESGLNYRIEGDGTKVDEMLPAAGSLVAKGSCVILYCGAQPQTQNVEVPGLTGLGYSEARDKLAAAGLYIRSDTLCPPEGKSVIVRTQSAEAGTYLPPGRVVEVSLADTDESFNGYY